MTKTMNLAINYKRLSTKSGNQSKDIYRVNTDEMEAISQSAKQISINLASAGDKEINGSLLTHYTCYYDMLSQQYYDAL